MTTEYDAIVVGAGCAGTPTAMLLARRGYRVLLVDRAPPSSHTLSTLLIHPPGIAALRRWGLLDEVVASGCPPIDTYAFDPGPLTLAGRPLAHDGIRRAYAPRRRVLDGILVDAAARAGVEVRERFGMDDLVVEEGTVVGIRGRGDGRSTVERARVVVGADGHDSWVADAVGAQRYGDKPVLSHVAYTFWSGLPVDCAHWRIREDRAIVSMPTNDGLTLVLVSLPAGDASAFSADVATNYMQVIERDPELAARIGGARREEGFASGGVPNFLRKPFGPGWALVGDAGYTKDPITFQGISDAFRDAELCAAAVDQAFEGGRPYDEAMAAYHHTRDEQVLPIYDITTHLGGFRATGAGVAGVDGRRARCPGGDGRVRERDRRYLATRRVRRGRPARHRLVGRGLRSGIVTTSGTTRARAPSPRTRRGARAALARPSPSVTTSVVSPRASRGPSCGRALSRMSPRSWPTPVGTA